MAGNYRHWKLETDRDNILWLSPRQGGRQRERPVRRRDGRARPHSRRAGRQDSAGAYHPLGKRLRIHRRADVEEFTKLKDADDVMRMVKRGWDLYNKLASRLSRRLRS